MFENVIIDVAIGLAVVYLVFSLLCSTVVEFVAGLLSLRGKQLERGIRYLVEDEEMADKLLQHPVLSKLSDKHRKASYIPAENFRIALLDTLSFFDDLPETKKIEQAIEKMPDGSLKTSIHALWKDSEADFKVFRAKVETWFTGNMVRVSGWYKRQIQKILLVIAFILAAMMNIDSIRIAKELPNNAELRASLIESAQFQVQQTTVKNGEKPSEPSADSVKKLTEQYRDIQYAINDIESMELPIGWHNFSHYSIAFQWYDWLLMLVGWFISAFAASMGADFWFNSIGKLVNLRAAGKPADSQK